MDNHGTTETIVKATPNGETKVEKLDTCIKSHGHISLTVIDEEDGRWGHPGSSSSSDSALSTPCTVKEVEAQSLFNFWKTHRIVEKIVYVTAVLTLVFLVHALLTAQWLLPYYYAISAPVLILIRVILYWKFKWQFFLLDFCYAANTLWYIFIWAVPYSEHLFCVVFALANGPLLWAVVVYRNSLVFHSLDKVTSSFIHLLPVFLSFGIRWYGRTASWNWYRPFIPHLLEPSFVWLVAVPLGCFVLHSILYMIVVDVIIKPSEDYVTSYRYLTSREDSLLFKVFNIFGPRVRFLIYNLFNWMFCLCTLVLTRVMYQFFIVHCISIAFVFLICIFNGATFYVDVFSARGFQLEID